MSEILNEILQAEGRIRPYIRETPLVYSPYFSGLNGGEVYFKCENIQHTGSFKVRGALNKLLSLPAELREQGVVTASTGNHGAATAFALKQVGGQGQVFVPEHAAAGKLANMEQWGATINKFGDDGVVAENEARRTAEAAGTTYISPYNDPQVIGGQGTIGVELARQIETADAVLVALGGGGLISGVAAYVKAVWPQAEVVACSPQNSAVMMHSVKAGEILDLDSLPTLSDGTAGGVEAGSITFDLCAKLIDRFVAVTEEEIKQALRLFMGREHMMIEGAAAVAIAAYLQEVERYRGKKVVIVICGGNISLDVLGKALQED